MFYVYLLRSAAAGHSQATYVGFTNDPRRRIRQHNGEIAGGARTTRRKRPWEMVCVVRGFTCKRTALQFEWAWQHPSRSRWLKDPTRGFASGRGVRAKLRIAGVMLLAEPWRALPLDVMVLSEVDEATARGAMPLERRDRVIVGRLSSLGEASAAVAADGGAVAQRECRLCFERTRPEREVRCEHEGCAAPYHLRCLADWLLGADARRLIPEAGDCAICGERLEWPRVVAELNRRRGVMGPRPSPARVRRGPVSPSFGRCVGGGGGGGGRARVARLAASCSPKAVVDLSSSDSGSSSDSNSDSDSDGLDSVRRRLSIVDLSAD